MSDIAKALTREIEARELWRGGMRRVRSDRALRSRDLGMAYCDVREREVRCIVWDGERGSLFGLLPDEAWDIDLEDAATAGVLWDVLSEHAWACDTVAALSLSYCGRVAWADMGREVDMCAASIGEALLMMWGVEVTP